MPNAVKRWPLEEHSAFNPMPQARLVLPAMILACGIGLNVKSRSRRWSLAP